MTVAIRPAAAGDAPRVAQINVESWNLGFGEPMPPLVLDGGWVSRWASGYREAILWTLAGYDRGQRFYESAGWKRDGAVRDDGHQVSFRHPLR